MAIQSQIYIVDSIYQDEIVFILVCINNRDKNENNSIKTIIVILLLY